MAENTPYLILPILSIIFSQIYYQLENNEGEPDFQYFSGDVFRELMSPIAVLIYLIGRPAALSVYFALD